MGVALAQLAAENYDNKYGALIQMAQCHLPANNSASFVEREQPCAKNAMPDKRTQLGGDELQMLVVLRMGVKSMRYMKTNTSYISGVLEWTGGAGSSSSSSSSSSAFAGPDAGGAGTGTVGMPLDGVSRGAVLDHLKRKAAVF